MLENFIQGNDTQAASSAKHKRKVNALKLSSAWLGIEEQKEERKARKRFRNAKRKLTR